MRQCHITIIRLVWCVGRNLNVRLKYPVFARFFCSSRFSLTKSKFARKTICIVLKALGVEKNSAHLLCLMLPVNKDHNCQSLSNKSFHGAIKVINYYGIRSRRSLELHYLNCMFCV